MRETELVMCRDCGEFVTAERAGDDWTAAGACPSCDGESFKRVASD